VAQENGASHPAIQAEIRPAVYLSAEVRWMAFISETAQSAKNF
jgi:hypothetical protein